jgi:hypothetical protein
MTCEESPKRREAFSLLRKIFFEELPNELGSLLRQVHFASVYLPNCDKANVFFEISVRHGTMQGFLHRG